MSSAPRTTPGKTRALFVACARQQPEFGRWVQEQLPLEARHQFAAAVAAPTARPELAPAEAPRPSLRKCRVTPMSAQLEYFARSVNRPR